jgi:hypothetical protein
VIIASGLFDCDRKFTARHALADNVNADVPKDASEKEKSTKPKGVYKWLRKPNPRKSSVKVRDIKPTKDARGGDKGHLLGSSLASSSTTGKHYNKVVLN